MCLEEVKVSAHSGLGNGLVCPKCQGIQDGDYLHHGKVVIKDRDKEDGPGRAVTVDTSGIYSCRLRPEDMDGRRDSLWIQFWCETCGDQDLWLTFLQHKGKTYLAWCDRAPVGAVSTIEKRGA